MMKKVEIQWRKTTLNSLSQEEDTWFYALSRGNALLYIGISYHQDITKEIKQTLRAFDISTSGLSIWLGYIIETDYGRITHQIVRDIESLLIFTHQPTYNTQCMTNYTGRDNLKVKNRRCKLLRPCVKVQGGRIYYTCR